jgi:soluble lytic murein transglycosylase-like protein
LTLVALVEQWRDDLPAWLPPEVSRWKSEIKTAASANGIDADLLAILTLLESGGNPRARSHQGAIGLVQVLPSTAASLASRHGFAGSIDLEDPAVNLDIGARYLARQLDEFGEAGLAIAAYNAGPGRVRRVVSGTASMPLESRNLRNLAAQLWKERDQPTSATFTAMTSNRRRNPSS